MKKTYNWGIMGPGFIADKVLPSFAKAEGARVLAVGSNTPGKAGAFAGKWKIPRAYENYEELVNDPDVDIIYITTPNAFHLDHARLAMEHGKNVLCEKPFALNAKAAEEMKVCAEKQGVFLMEAMWTRFMPAVIKIKEWVDQGVIGEVHQVVSDFSYDHPYDPGYHLYDPKAGGGTLLDGGIYPLSFAGYIYGECPREYFGYANLKNGVDVRDSVVLRFSQGQMASFICGADTASPWCSMIYGSKGCIRVPSFFAASGFEMEHYESGKKQCVSMPFEGLGYQFELCEVMNCIDQGKKESSRMPLAESVTYMKVMDALRQSWGVVYPGESRRAGVENGYFKTAD